MLLTAAVAFGQGKDAKSFRQTGYKGSVLYTNHYLVWQGVETSHGYMFNEHHYLGAGAGFMLAPIDNVPTFGRGFVDYNAYICKKIEKICIDHPP